MFEERTLKRLGGGKDWQCPNLKDFVCMSVSSSMFCKLSLAENTFLLPFYTLTRVTLRFDTVLLLESGGTCLESLLTVHNLDWTQSSCNDPQRRRRSKSTVYVRLDPSQTDPFYRQTSTPVSLPRLSVFTKRVEWWVSTHRSGSSPSTYYEEVEMVWFVS